MQWGRQFGMVCTSLYLQLKPLEGESFSQTGLWAWGKGEMPSSSSVVPGSTPALYSALNVQCRSGQAPPEEGKLSVLLCSSSTMTRLGFWGCLCLFTPVSATRKLEQGWNSQVLSPALCPIQVLLSEHNIWARISKGFQDMVHVWCQPWPCWICELWLAPANVADKHLCNENMISSTAKKSFQDMSPGNLAPSPFASFTVDLIFFPGKFTELGTTWTQNQIIMLTILWLFAIFQFAKTYWTHWR